MEVWTIMMNQLYAIIFEYVAFSFNLMQYLSYYIYFCDKNNYYTKRKCSYTCMKVYGNDVNVVP